MMVAFMGDIGHFSLTYLVACAGDTALLLIPFLFLRKHRWLTLIPVWGLAIFFFANAVNVRFWGDTLTFSAVTMAGNAGSILAKSIWGLLRARDLIFAVVPALYTILLFSGRKHDSQFDRSRALIPVAVSLVLFIVGQCALTRSSMKWKEYESMPVGSFLEETGGRITTPIFSRVNYLTSNGLTVYFVRNVGTLWQAIFDSNDITDERRREIARFLAEHNDATYASQFSGNSGKNVVLIIVESLNADVIGKRVGGFEVTPTLNSILRREGTVSSLRVISQVKDGGSSDGQMLINTGLLPLKDGSAAMRFGSANTFPSLAKELHSHQSVAIFADNGKVWNQTGACRSYGFAEVLTSDDFISPAAERGVDGAMFDLAIDCIRRMMRPFFLECISLSMHVPFDEPAAEKPAAILGSSLWDGEKKYLTVTHYFDRQLGLFLDKLYNIVPEEETILIITSDHSQSIAVGASTSGGNEASFPAVFIAANTSKTFSTDKLIGQVNIYPTLLDILGVQTSDYRGLGKSIFSPQLNGAVDVFGNPYGQPVDDDFDACDISNDIIKSNYFESI